MVDLDKIKSDIKNLCSDIEQTYRKLDNRKTSCEEENKKIDAVKAELLLLEQRRVNARQSVKDESFAASEKKKEYTSKKVKYKKLIEGEESRLDEHSAKVTAEIDAMRIKEMGRFKSEKGKITSEITLAKQELAEIRSEYVQTKRMLSQLKEGIKI